MSDKDMKSLEKRIAKIELRNERVELDKLWETSWMRKIAIAVLTYAVVWTYLQFVVQIDAWVNAIVPTIGFLLSTTTLTFVKSVWLNKIRDGK